MKPVFNYGQVDMPRMFALLAFAWASLANVTHALQDVQIVAESSADEIFAGESVDYQVEIRNAQNPVAPDMNSIKQTFEVVELGNQARNQSSISIINGRVTQNQIFSHVYQYRLTPKRSGDLSIPAATATIEGRELRSRELPLRVMPAEEQDVVKLEIKADQTKVYPTQPFDVTLRILVQPLPGSDARINPLRPLRRQPPHIEINWVDVPAGISANKQSEWLQPLLARDGAGFTLNDVSARTDSFFGGSQAAVFDLSKGRETRDSLDGRIINYFANELTRTFTAEKAGLYTFGPAIVKGVFVTGMKLDEYEVKRIIAIAAPLTIEVRDVPAPRPASFCGGIGDYQWSVSASPMKLRVGDPLTLTLDVERGAKSGSLDLISAPDLSTVPQVVDQFELIDKNPTGRVEGSKKRFSYALRPKRANVGVPPLSISTFDPRSEKFKEFATEPILLDVTEAAHLTGGELVGTSPMAQAMEIKTRSEGIFQNITDPTVLRDDRVSLRRWSQVVAGVWLASGVMSALLLIHRRRSSDAAWQRRQQARRAANKRLKEARDALKQGVPKEALRLVRTSILGLVADTRDRVEEGLTTSEVDDLLSTASVPAGDRSEVARLLESIESAEYGAGQAAEPASAIENAASLVARIAPLMERSK